MRGFSRKTGGLSLGYPLWSETYTYDGFGNLLDKNETGGAPMLTQAVNASTNRITDQSYDSNGNQLSGVGTYDYENRVMLSSDLYVYGPDNVRVWKARADGTEEIYYYDPAGRRLGIYYELTASANTLYIASKNTSFYFKGELLSTTGTSVTPIDRLGSTYNGFGYFPYGEEYQATTNDADKFATYYRDATTGLDYAKNRYYSNTLGRFLSADPVISIAVMANPSGGWNRYVYTRGDPVNFLDRSGLYPCGSDFGQNGDTITVGVVDCDPVDSGATPIDPSSYGTSPDPYTGINTQGNSNSNFIHVGDPSKTGSDEDRIRDVLGWIQANIDPNCAKWLSGVSGAITGLLGNPAQPDTVTIGYGTFDTRNVAAFTGNNPNQTDLPPGYAITINAIGAFFVGTYTQNGHGYGLSTNGYAGGTSQAQVSILLHELAHLLNATGFQPDFQNPQAGAKNDNLIQKNCKKTLNAAKNIP
jgi:RHS repeat-associated protein